MGDGRDHLDHRQQPVIGRWWPATRRQREWRVEHGPGHDLRLYDGGRPTRVVAATGWDHGERSDRRTAVGPDVLLFLADNRIVVAERRPGQRAVRLQIPLRSCVDASIEEGPGLPGMGLLGLVLTVRMGEAVTFRAQFWFEAAAHSLLRELVGEVTAAVPPPMAPPATLPPLAVRLAPDHDDWVVFRAADDGVIVSEEPR